MHRPPEVCIRADLYSEESGRRDSYDCERYIVELDRFTNHCRIGAKSPLPEAVADDSDGLRITGPIVILCQSSTGRGGHAQQREEITGDLLGVDELRFCSTQSGGDHPALGNTASGEDAGKTVFPIAQPFI